MYMTGKFKLKTVVNTKNVMEFLGFKKQERIGMYEIRIKQTNKLLKTSRKALKLSKVNSKLPQRSCNKGCTEENWKQVYVPLTVTKEKLEEGAKIYFKCAT